MKRIVALGGGTGPLSLLNIHDYGYGLFIITSIIDDGGSTGELVKRHPGILPPGDMRQVISNSSAFNLREILERRPLSSSEIDPSWSVLDVLSYYLDEKERALFHEIFDVSGHSEILKRPLGLDNLKGHPLGNLLLVSFMLGYGNSEGIERLCKLVRSVEVIPASESPSTLYFIPEGNSRPKTGEKELDNHHSTAEPIERLWLNPDPEPYGKAIDAIKGADVVVISPTSLYANIISLLLIRGFREALKDKFIIWVGNIMTEWNQTAYSSHSLTGIGHMETLRKYLGRYPDHVIAPKLKGQTLGEVFGAYESEGASPVLYRERDFTEKGIGYTEANMVDVVKILDRGIEKTVLRHDRNILATVLDQVIKAYFH